MKNDNISSKILEYSNFLNSESKGRTNRIFCGISVFNKLKNSCSILYGSSFKINNIEIILQREMEDNSIATDDAKLADVLDLLKKELEQ